MKSEDGRLRAVFAALAEHAAPTSLCPEPAALWSAVSGEAPPSEARRLVLHTAECPACAEAWRLARELRERSPAVNDPVAPSAARPRRWNVGAALGAAAAGVVLATAVALIARGPGRAIPPAFRDGEAPVLRSLVSESRLLPRGQCVLRWTSGPPGTRYALRVVTETLDPIERVQGLDRAEHQVPEAKLRSLAPGSRLLWQVEAARPDGTRQTSATFVSRLE
jgi:hypothetical protein